MPLVLFIIGVALLGLDRALDRTAALKYQHQLDYYTYYYRPLFQRRQFFGLIFLIILFSLFLNYVIFGKVSIISNILILPLLVVLIYVLIVLLTVFDYLIRQEPDMRLNFSILERDFIQLFTLALFFPFIAVAYLLKLFLTLFTVPSRKIFLFNSFAGLLGIFLLGVSLVLAVR
jgi:hypothetical protein